MQKCCRVVVITTRFIDEGKEGHPENKEIFRLRRSPGLMTKVPCFLCKIGWHLPISCLPDTKLSILPEKSI